MESGQLANRRGAAHKSGDMTNKLFQIKHVRYTTISITLALLVAVYFLSTIIFFPHFYLSLAERYPTPEVELVKVSNSSVHLGEPVEITIVGANRGSTSDMQTLSVSFPNMTDTHDINIKSDNFTQHPLIIKGGQEVGSHYEGNQYPTYSTYPIVEAYNRPWDGGTARYITLDIIPESPGKFQFQVKSVAIPHSDILHYPTSGTKDQQGEYVTPYFIFVKKH